MTSGTDQAANDPLIGQPIGRWVVTSLCGVGGSGRVYIAEQQEIGSRVAIKVLGARAADDREAVERFFAEARAVNLIRHEGIVQVLDLDVLPDGRPYIVMEHLEGASLSRVIEARGAHGAHRLPLGALAAWAREVLAALGAAHARGIVHRDVKPANLWVTPAGRARVLDFGLAKLAPGLDARAMTTRSGLLLGTPHYMAPEQADAKPVDARGDLYSLGVVLYEAATGVRPFDGASLYEVLRQQVEHTPPPPRQRRPDMPAALDKVIRRALEKDPTRRFADAAEMAGALAEAVHGLPPPAFEALRPPAPMGGVDATASTVVSGAPLSSVRTGKSTGSRPYRTASIAVAVGALLAVTAVVLTRVGGRQAANPVASPAVTDAAALAAAATIADASIADAGPLAAHTIADAAVAPAVVFARPDAGTMPRPRAALGPKPAGPKAPTGPTLATKRADAGPPAAGAGIASDGKGPPIIQEPVKSDVERWRDGEERRLPAPTNPSAFDLVGYAPTAATLARQVYADAELVMAYATWIRSDGLMDLTEKGHAGYMFRTPSMAGHDARCYIMIKLYAKSGELQAQLGADPNDRCNWPAAPTPSCRPKDVWTRALEQGAPADGRAYMRYLVRKGQGTWEFTLMGGGLDFKAADQCP